MPRKWLIGTVKTITASTSPSRSRIRSRWRCQRGVTYRQITSRTSLSARVSSGCDSARREVAVALQPRRGAARAGEGLGLAVERVRRGPPPRRLDRAPAVRRHDQVDAGLVRSPSRAATTRACSRSGSRGRRPRRREDLRRRIAGSVARRLTARRAAALQSGARHVPVVDATSGSLSTARGSVRPATAQCRDSRVAQRVSTRPGARAPPGSSSAGS